MNLFRNVLVPLIVSAVFLVGTPDCSWSQISRGGCPLVASSRTSLTMPPKRLPAVDRAAELALDSLESSKGIPLRFGVPFDVDFSTENSGIWEVLPDGSRVWTMRIECHGAFSTNLIYRKFWLPKGGELYLYNEDQSMILGAFTDANNKPHGQFASGLLKGEVCILEYHEPATASRSGVIEIERVVHAYRNLFDSDELKDAMDFGSSGACNNNVNCPEGQPWQDEKRSVALITTQGGFRLCSGALVNNVRQDLKPYLLTANHCLGSEATWVFMFNYESPTCVNIDGPTWMSVSGSILRASSAASDFALLELSEAPPDSYNVYYAGWSAVDVASSSSVAIHHPEGDIKKISFDNQPTQSTSYLSNGSGDGSHWRIVQWDDGTTEPGSSGSPLFDQDHRIIGQLHGGYASCASLTSDWYGKFSRSWNGGGSPSARLKDWLDPDNTGATTLDGRNGLGLVITHAPLSDTPDTLNDISVTALIESRGTLFNDSILLNYNTGSGWNIDTLTPTANPDEYEGIIPRQSPGTIVQYYLTAANSLGDHYSSQMFAFTVIGRRVDVVSQAAAKQGIVDDTVTISLDIVNKGSISDSYYLSILSAGWNAYLTDANKIPLASTPNLFTNEQFTVQMHVIIGQSQLNEVDTLYLLATSMGDGSTHDSLLVVAISEGVPLAVPISEQFTAPTIDDGVWAFGTSSGITFGAANPMSPPYALLLSGNSGGADTFVTRPFDLSQVSGVVLSYYYEDGGFSEPADSGDNLCVDFLDSSGAWQTISEHYGSGPTMPAFLRSEILLPQSALHKRCRFRFRGSAQPGDFDYWFIDDISVSIHAPSDIDVATSTISKWLPPNDSSFGSLTITNQGSGTLTGTLAFSANTKNNWTKSNGERLSSPRLATESQIGGPDAYGYTWKSSDNPGGPAFSWIPVSQSGIDIVDALNDDNVVGPIDIGFSFPWYGSLYSHVYVGSNGTIGFAWPGMESSQSAPMPGLASPNDFIALAWRDLDPDNVANGNAHVYVDTAGGRCVISFYVYPHYQAGPGGYMTAQILLYPDGSVLMQYLNIGSSFNGSNTVVGFENLSGDDGLTISNATNFLHGNLAVRVYPPDTWFRAHSSSFSVAPGGSKAILYEFDDAGLDTGLYTGIVTVTSNDPLNQSIQIPVELNRPALLPFICGDVNNDRMGPNVVDLTFLVAYLFASGAPPTHVASADVNNSSGNPNVVDVTYLVIYLFGGGTAPNCP